MLDKLKWYYSRLKVMSMAEVFFYRIPQAIQLKILGRLQARSKLSIRQTNPKFIALEYSINDIEKLFFENPFNKEFPLFEINLNLEEVTDWRKDYKSGKTSPIQYYGNIRRQDFELNGDVKYLSELSRMEFLPFLAFHSIKNLESLKLIEKIVLDWNRQNPYLKSIHWTSGIEIAIRSVNLIYSHLILVQFNKITLTIDDEIKRQLSLNYNYLKKHLSKYSSSNNHLTAELMGLIVLSCYLDIPSQDLEKWKKKFFEQIEIQLLDDGVHMERCSRYHSEVVDQILVAFQFLKQVKVPIPEKIEAKFKKSFQFIQHFEYRGIKTLFGDNDEGSVIKPFWQNHFSLYDSQLSSANYLYDTLYRYTQKLDFRNYLLFGKTFENKIVEDQENDQLFKSSGYAFWYDHQEKLKFSFDVGELGDHLMAAHAHSDLFHFNLSKDNIPFIVDSGTYQYHSKDIFWRDYFRSAKAHNVVTFNKKNHASINGRMSWVNLPHVKIKTYKNNDETSYCCAETDCFKKNHINYQREMILNKSLKKITIRDKFDVTKTEKNNLESFIHFHPSVKVIKKEGCIIAKAENVSLTLKNVNFENAEIIKGNSNLPLGWYSSRFGIKQPTTSLRISKLIEEDCFIETDIFYGREL